MHHMTQQAPAVATEIIEPAAPRLSAILSEVADGTRAAIEWKARRQEMIQGNRMRTSALRKERNKHYGAEYSIEYIRNAVWPVRGGGRMVCMCGKVVGWAPGECGWMA